MCEEGRGYSKFYFVCSKTSGIFGILPNCKRKYNACVGLSLLNEPICNNHTGSRLSIHSDYLENSIRGWSILGHHVINKIYRNINVNCNEMVFTKGIYF